MKKTEMIALATMAVIFVGMGSLAWGGGEAKDRFVPGNSIVHDPAEDLLLENGEVPAYADIENARITEVGRDRIDLSITPVEVIPAEPKETYLEYYWQFQNVCEADSPTDKYGMVAIWNGVGWSANWLDIDCDSQTITMGASAEIAFEEGGVRVRASLNDFWVPVGEDPVVAWYAGVRLSAYAPPVDVVPAVMKFDYNGVLIFYPENLATWESH